MKRVFFYSVMAMMAMCVFTACGGDDKDGDLSGDYVQTEQGVHRITVTFSGNTDGWGADLYFTATLGNSGFSNIYENGKQVNDMTGAWGTSGMRDYDITSGADCDLMTLTLSVTGRADAEPVSVTLKGYVNGKQTNMKVIDYKPGEVRKTISFAADNINLDY